MDKAQIYAEITKSEDQDDGTIKVYGKVSDETLDADGQICDANWLKSAIPAWYQTGGNVRYMHQSDAVGVATEYEEKADGHYIQALVVDDAAVKKIKKGVLRGFSIGIRNPRIMADKAAPGGRLVGGTVCEISLVDRGSNPAATFVIAKSARPGMRVRADQYDAETGLVQVGEMVEKADAADVPADTDGPEMVTVPDAPVEKFAEADAPEAPADPDAPEVPAVDAPAAVEVGADSGAPVGGDVAAAGEGGSGAAAAGAPGDTPVVEVAPDAPLVRPGEAVLSPADELARRAALAAVAPPVDAAPVPEVAPVVDAPEAPAEPAEKSVTADVPGLDLDALAVRVADLLKAAGVAPVVEAAPVGGPVLKGAGAGDVAAAVAHLAARGRAVPDITKGEGVITHDVGTLRSVRNGLLSLIVAEATEALAGDDETCDMRMLLDSLSIFLSWWQRETLHGEAPPSTQVGVADPAVDPEPGEVVDAAEELASVLVGGPDSELGGGVAAVGGVKAAEPDAPAAVDAVAKAASPDAPASIETPAPVAGSSKADQPEAVKAPDAEADEAAVLQKAVATLTAENAALAARVEQLAKAAAPGGPVRTRPATALRVSREGDMLRTKAAGYRRAAQSGLAPDLAKEYERLAAECDAKAAALTAES